MKVESRVCSVDNRIILGHRPVTAVLSIIDPIGHEIKDFELSFGNCLITIKENVVPDTIYKVIYEVDDSKGTAKLVMESKSHNV